MRPEQVGPYTLLERLGTGGMGEVFLAQQEEPVRRQVAVKLVKLGIASGDVLRRFERERRTLARMNHPHIAAVLDAGVSESGRPYFVLELVRGEPITSYCERESLDTRARLRLFLQVCKAVQHAHHKGIVHRDLKPSNLLVAHDEGGALCKVIDFGVARAVAGDAVDATSLTLLGQQVGTVAYMSPEQAGHGPDVDTRTDVYSLGVVLYELLTGRRPLQESLEQASTATEIERVLRQEEPQRPSVHVRRLGGDLDWICLKALEKDRERRYGSPAELADDLRRTLAHEPIAARPPTHAYRLKKLATRHPVAAPTATAIVGLFVFGLATTTTLLGAARQADARERALGVDLARLSDRNLLRQAERQAASHWPAHPARLAALETWLRNYAEPLAAALPKHLERLGELSRDVAAGKLEPGDWERLSLVTLVAELDRFLDPDPKRGLVANIRTRIEAARELEAEMAQARFVDAWRTAIGAIRDSPLFGGLTVEPQVGLLPLGADPQSGFEEFLYLPSGAAPEPHTDSAAFGRWRVTAETGIVLVLLPGGPFVLGGQAADPAAPRFDPRATGEMESLRLDPFFISKFELTQGQFSRLMGRNPSRHKGGGGAHPVERVNWDECVEVLRRIGMVLPTEAQWEYAARGGSDSIWWCGDREEDLVGCANIADRSMHRADLLRGYECTLKIDDGHATHAPVGSYRANGFGLHDTAGNVYEWTSDVYGCKGVRLREGDGRILCLEDSYLRVDRGGSFARPAMQARSDERDFWSAGTRLGHVGLRPARALGIP